MAGAQDRVSLGMAQASSVMAERSDPIANYSGAIANHSRAIANYSRAIAKHAEAQEAQEAQEAKEAKEAKTPEWTNAIPGAGAEGAQWFDGGCGKWGITGSVSAVLRGGAAGAGRQRGPRR